MKLDELRQHYLSMAPYPIDGIVPDGAFTQDERAALQKYGHWFEAIWSGKVQLTTDRLTHFANAKKLKPSERTKWEELWIRYEQERCPF